ncbi:MAG: hypothetical protein QNJ51_22320 [Calothrix sp. MO_167.B12]|nr:hypothetical protein [Calothrix sp. MO_167.B12]
MSTIENTLEKQQYQKIKIFLEDEKQTQEYIKRLNLYRKSNRFIREIQSFEAKLAELTQKKETLLKDLNTQDFQPQRDRYCKLLKEDINLDHEIKIIKDSKERLKNILLELEIYMTPQDSQSSSELVTFLNSYEPDI